MHGFPPSLQLVAWAAIFFLVFRAYWVIKISRTRRSLKRSSDETCSLAIFLGSGGHTTEMLVLLSCLDFARYKSRTYIVSHGDNFSAQKAEVLERSRGSANDDFRIIHVPRARRVHQSLLATPPTALRSLVSCVALFLMPTLKGHQSVPSDVLLVNGPGTCLILCLAIFFCRILGLKTPRIVYIESFARVSSLSLSGRMVLPFADSFVVQWPSTLAGRAQAKYAGWLV